MKHKVQTHYEIESLNFGQPHGGTNGVAIVTGCASYSALEARFRFLISPRDDMVNGTVDALCHNTPV
jgi:hypothetical protein